MPHRRTRDSGQFRTNIELVIVVGIIGILAGIGIPQLLKLRDARGSKCLAILAGQMGGPLPEGSVCPKSSKPYVPAKGGLSQVVACPAPEKHLDSTPRFVRNLGSSWQLRQSLPEFTGKPLELGQGHSVVTESPNRISLHLMSAKFVRWFIGPLFLGILVLLLISCLVNLGWAIFKKGPRDFVLPVVLGIVFSVLAWFQLSFLASSAEFIVEPSRLTRIDYHLGSSKSAVYDGCLGIVPVTPASGSRVKLYLVHAPNANGDRVTLLDTLAGDRLDVVSRLNQILAGP